jgi:flagellar basal-body rod modification protein FlgD
MSTVTGTTNADLYSQYGVNATKTTTTTTAPASSNKVEDTFMELLLAELRNQNPMEPMDSSQMVTQMAQMNSLQELQKITASMKGVDQSNQFLTASSLIGKQVSYVTEDKLNTGLVSAFSIDNNVISLLVNDTAISLDDVLGVAAGSAEA